MTRKKYNNQQRRINGLNIYYDEHNRAIFYNIFNKSGYVINESNEKKYVTYSMRLPLGVIAGYFGATVSNNLLIGIGIGLAAYAFFCYLFYGRFLKELTTIPNFKRTKKDSFIKRQAELLSLQRIIAVIIMALLLAVAVAANVTISHFEGAIAMLNYMLAIAAVIFSLVYIGVLINKLKNK